MARIIVDGLGSRDIGSVARLPKENRLEEEPYVIIPPVFADNIRKVMLAGYVIVSCESCCNRFPHFVERFVELGVDPGGAIDNGLIVTEHVILGFDRYAEVSEEV
jgi:hypothetical protein